MPGVAALGVVVEPSVAAMSRLGGDAERVGDGVPCGPVVQGARDLSLTVELSEGEFSGKLADAGERGLLMTFRHGRHHSHQHMLITKRLSASADESLRRGGGVHVGGGRPAERTARHGVDAGLDAAQVLHPVGV